jgi:hypothetical protein
MHSKFLVSAAAGALLAMTGAAFAQSAVVATTDLNVRAGPGPQHQVVGVLGAGQSVNLDGCLESSKWCVVAFVNGQGWVVLTERPANSGVRIVEAPVDVDGGATGAVTGGVTGAVAGAIIGGPAGAVVGGGAGIVAGGAAGTVIDPPARVRTYVRSNEIEPVFLDGEVVVGAGLPETVVLRDIPDYEYRYAYVNSQRVLVEPSSRRIVYVMR